MTNIKTQHVKTLWCHPQEIFYNKVIHNEYNLYSLAIKKTSLRTTHRCRNM